MVDENISASRIQPPEGINPGQTTRQAEINRLAVMQEASSEEFQQWSEMFNPMAISRRFESLEVKAKRKGGREEETERAEKKDRIQNVKKLEEVAEQYQRRNPELNARTLLLLRSRIARGDTKDEIWKKILDVYADYSLADEALDYLRETAETEMVKIFEETKEDVSTRFGREIRAGRNIASQAREFSQQGLGSPTGLRDLYRDLTGNPRDSLVLFDQLHSHFSYEKMKAAIDFILHSLGSDLKAKGPSISRGELHRLLTESRSLQAILGIYRFFKSRMALILSAFERQKLELPPRLTFEFLAKLFAKFLQDRYPTSDKVIALSSQLDLSEELLAQVVVYTQMRDAVRQVAPKLFKTDQHRQDVLMAFIDAIEDLDEKLEEESEEEK